MATQGDETFFYSWYPTLNWLQTEIFAWKEQFEEEARTDDTMEYLANCCSRSLAKCQKYFEGADKTPIVFAAVVLNPTMKNRWFEQLWEGGSEEQLNWSTDIVNKVKALWRSEYKKIATSESVYSQPRTTSSLSNTRRGAAPSEQQLSIEEVTFKRLTDFKRVKLDRSTSAIDALDEYLLQDTILIDSSHKFDCLQYWFNQRLSQPELAKFAFDTLAIPMMSDDNERAFSSGRDLITYRRNRLKSTLIEATQCLRQWYGPPQPSRRANGQLQPAFDNDEAIQNDYNEQEAIRIAQQGDRDVDELYTD